MASPADRIAQVLKDRGWSQRELARRAKYTTESQLGNTLRRIRENPGRVEVETMQRIADAAGVSLHWLLTGVEPGAAANEAGSAPHLINLPNWPGLLAASRMLAPDYDDWVWDEVGRSYPLTTAPVTPAMLVDLAELVVKHVPPPARHPQSRPAAAPAEKRRAPRR